MQRFMGLRIFGISVSVEYDKQGNPTGDAFGHVVHGLGHEVRLDTSTDMRFLVLAVNCLYFVPKDEIHQGKCAQILTGMHDSS